jgi:hypothetical protein
MSAILLFVWHAFRPRNRGGTRAVDGSASVWSPSTHEGMKLALYVRREGIP